MSETGGTGKVSPAGMSMKITYIKIQKIYTQLYYSKILLVIGCKNLPIYQRQ